MEPGELCIVDFGKGSFATFCKVVGLGMLQLLLIVERIGRGGLFLDGFTHFEGRIGGGLSRAGESTLDWGRGRAELGDEGRIEDRGRASRGKQGQDDQQDDQGDQGENQVERNELRPLAACLLGLLTGQLGVWWRTNVCGCMNRIGSSLGSVSVSVSRSLRRCQVRGRDSAVEDARSSQRPGLPQGSFGISGKQRASRRNHTKPSLNTPERAPWSPLNGSLLFRRSTGPPKTHPEPTEYPRT